MYELCKSSISLDNISLEIDKLFFSYYHNLNWIKNGKLDNSNYEIRTKLKVEITTSSEQQQQTTNKKGK